MEKELEFLREQGVDSGLIDGVEEFRAKYDVAEEAKGRVICPDMPFYGREVLEMGIAALLEGENLLLTGPKATGKNMLAERNHMNFSLKQWIERTRTVLILLH